MNCLLSASQSSGTFAPAALRVPRVGAVSQSVTVINPVSQVTAPISGSPIRPMARPSQKRCPPLRRSRKPSEKWRNSGNSSSSLVSFWEPTRRSAVCGLSMRRQKRSGKKNGRSDPARNHARNRTVLAGGVPGAAQHGAPRSGSDRDGHALSFTPGGRHCVAHCSNSQLRARKGAGWLALAANKLTTASNAASPC